MRGPLAVLLAGSLACLAQAPASDFLLPGPAAPAPVLTAALLELGSPALAAHIARLAAPGLRGRGLGTPELERVAEDLAARLASFGLRPLGSPAQSWFQPVPLRLLEQPKARLTLRAAGHTWTFDAGAAGLFPKLAPGTLRAPVVFAGHGIQEPDLAHDDFRGLDVKGKAVLFLDGTPPGDAWKKSPFQGRHAATDPEDRFEARLDRLHQLGAVAAIVLQEDFPDPGKAGRLAAEPGFLEPPGAAPEGIPLLRIPAAQGRSLPARLGHGATLTLETAGNLREVPCRNVIAVLPGSDEKLRGEAVLLGAHYDHLGVVDGKVHPGADDNASGVAALLEIARTCAAASRRPKRTLVFAFWTGEEEGKFGSRAYVRNPRWPLARTLAYLNLDMIAHPWSEAELRALLDAARPPNRESFLERVKAEDLVEPGVATGAPWLGPLLAAAGTAAGAPLHLDWTDGRHGGSDYRAFARAGLPFVRFFGAFHADYHKPGDTPERLDPAHALKVARVVLATAWLLADR